MISYYSDSTHLQDAIYEIAQAREGNHCSVRLSFSTGKPSFLRSAMMESYRSYGMWG